MADKLLVVTCLNDAPTIAAVRACPLTGGWPDPATTGAVTADGLTVQWGIWSSTLASKNDTIDCLALIPGVQRHNDEPQHKTLTGWVDKTKPGVGGG